MGDHHDLGFKAEYAKSGRASCKACKGSIAQDSLRLAIMVQSPMFDGKIPNWFHYACFWKRARGVRTDDIYGYDSLRWEDQQKIKEKIAGAGGGDGGDGEGSTSTGKDFNTEYAKSGKSTCRGCEDKIAKNEVRISRKDFESQRAKMYGPQDLWHHVDCFVENRDELDFGTDKNPNIITGFSNLKKEDQDMLIEKLGKGSTSGKKRKGETSKGSGGKKKKVEETAEEKALREQSQLLWKFRDALQKDVNNNAMKLLLELNGQGIPSGESKLLDRVADCMAFGALEKCPECKDGQLAYSADGYHCTGNMTEWTKCMYKTKTPKRKAFKIPKEYHDVECLKTYKFVKRDRVFPAVTVRTTEGPVSSSLDSVDGGVNFHPLEGMKFVVSGKFSKSKSEITKAVTKLGGTVVSKCDGKVAAVISTKDEVDKKSKAIKEAENADVHVVDEEFLTKVEKGGAALLITSHSIASWGSDAEKRIAQGSISKSVGKSVGKSFGKFSKRDEAHFTKNVPDKLKMTVKGGAAVDPDSGLENTAHVVEEKGSIYNAVLGLVDVVRGTNSYYKIQALEGDGKNTWWVFRAWGRVGTTVGGNKVERCGSRQSAIQNFKGLYFEKTNNEWENREHFKKFPNKFYPLDIDYGQDSEGDIKQISSKGSTSKLPKSVQDLVCMIFDVESMKKAMLEFEIDLKKMPLGKLSKKQIQSAYSVLTELLELTEKGGSATQILDASNRFYTLIPHDFGMKKPPMLDTKEIIKSKTEMLDNLLEIEVAYSMLKGGDAGEDPIDAHYKQLKTEIVPLPKEDEEFKRIVKYVKNTHAATHNMYELEVEEIWKIKREGEYGRYKPFRDLHNRKLLWHGSRVTNFGGILSQGLRIAPPEAPVTGYMFGKGVYFADMVSKSANYCRTSKQDPKGLMMLCEVALGNMYECTRAEYVNKLPKGKHSCKGLLHFSFIHQHQKSLLEVCMYLDTCNPSQLHYSDGVEIPTGRPVDESLVGIPLNCIMMCVQHFSRWLLFGLYASFSLTLVAADLDAIFLTFGSDMVVFLNFSLRFIVYDVAQINMKYLLKMDFKYKW
ncbi:poly [ADP-ribose] polymerase 1-like [Mercenaria mercenaria]|uniref:poly [ADP-ribose] polymerase 1-like n=1 Tax=Mercenaria mercenaria TaxID=6596 RepID=UPI00234F7310|nr:poly [ADP-ribose] polymerase 1-like [Mercenaria mercenaria]